MLQMSMRELSRASSLSIGALYTYFSFKDELLHIIQQYGLCS
jgi:AcrR family transcriptional regulator